MIMQTMVIAIVVLTISLVVLVIGNILECKDLKSFKKIKKEITEDIEKSKIAFNKLLVEYENKTQRNQDLDNEYLQKKEQFEDYIKTLQSLNSEKTEKLVQNYSSKEEKLKETYQKNKEELEEQIQDIEKELESLKRHKSAVVESIQKEQENKKQKDLYRLNLPERDLEDIKLLRSIQYKLSNQRILSMLIWQTFFSPVAKEKFKFIIGNKTKTGIYKITNTLNQKVYIGQARDIKKRLQEHMKCGLGIDCPANNKLYEAMKQDGLENFTFEVLEECPAEELNKEEKYYIEFYNSVSWGYNSQSGNRS